MTPAEQARAMGDYIREHGFSPDYDEALAGRPRCGCFVHAANVIPDVEGEMQWEIERALLKCIGAPSFCEDDLIAAGYASDADRSKAVEACYAAARMLEGKS